MKTRAIKKTALLTALLLTAGIVLSACGQGASERQTMYGAWKRIKTPAVIRREK
jgi:predicted small secreted protein